MSSDQMIGYIFVLGVYVRLSLPGFINPVTFDLDKNLCILVIYIDY